MMRGHRHPLLLLITTSSSIFNNLTTSAFTASTTSAAIRFASTSNFCLGTKAKAALFLFQFQRSIVHSSTIFASAQDITSHMADDPPEDACISSSSNVMDESSDTFDDKNYDIEYPGTAYERMMNVRNRVAQLNATAGVLDGPWEDVRRKLLWAGGLRDLTDVMPGKGYTGHAFNDFNHVDLTAMSDAVLDNTNDGKVKGIAIGNRLGRGIRIASLPELGSGGSWTCCQIGCHKDPPEDVAHLQFKSRIAFKLVWSPVNNFQSFVLVDDDGKLLAKGTPKNDGFLPPLRERMLNFQAVMGSKYALAADKLQV